MRCAFRFVLLAAILQTHPVVAGDLTRVNLCDGVGSCFPPEEPFQFKLEKSDPLYDTARDEHQRYLEGMEDYINCLDRERVVALEELRTSYNLFRNNFGKDGVFKYGADQGIGQ